ncbi:uncharacterized protein [Macrobrachium rosenbergii]|uniref:uncharacterized protein n=1 Tax=Macrobrachium rosenbergii TaxID=79674 RepID=UPI0034D5D250
MEKVNNGLLTDVTRVYDRACEATKIPRRSMERIIREGRNTGKEYGEPTFNDRKRSRPCTVTALDDFDKCVLRRIALRFYARQDLPTIAKIWEEARRDIDFKGCKESLRKLLHELGFYYGRVNSRKFLLERNDVAATRTKFLRIMKKVQENEDQPIIYLDETWLNQNYTVGKCWTTNDRKKAIGVNPPTGKGARLIILHAGSKEGFVQNAELIFKAVNDGDYHQQMNRFVFENWFKSQLLPNIPPSSVIVMDNASYHSVATDKPPTTADKKNTIKEWLIKKGADLTDDMQKCELLQLVKIHSARTEKEYVIDKLAREHGHRVVRLPLYHCQYNPIELIWGQVKNYVSQRNNFKMADLRPLMQEAIQKVTKENWANAIKHVKKLQMEDSEGDDYVEHLMESFVIELRTSDDDDDDD